MTSKTEIRLKIVSFLTLFCLSCSSPPESPLDSIIQAPYLFQIGRCYLTLAPDSSPMIGYSVKGNHLKNIISYSIQFDFFNGSKQIKNDTNNTTSFIFEDIDLGISEYKDFALTFYGWYGIDRVRLKILDYEFENEDPNTCNSLFQLCEEQYACLSQKDCELFSF